MYYNLFNIFLASLIMLFSLIPVLIVSILIKLTSPGKVFYYSERIGQRKNPFLMPKFRTMKINTPEVATHLLPEPSKHLTIIGPFLRKYSLDEIPQIISVLKGDMSLVGPRPSLHNQYDLIELRDSYDIHEIKPGITGWAQVNGRDDLSIREKVEFDRQYMKKKCLSFDIFIIWLTLKKVLFPKNISH